MSLFDFALLLLFFGALCFLAGYFIGGTRAANEITTGIRPHVRR